MQSVTFSEIVRVAEQPRVLSTLRAGPGLAALVLTLVLGLPALVLVFHLMDPGAPLAFIVLPVLAGALVPLMAALPGRLEVTTRFYACHLVGTLDDALAQLGYEPATRAPGTLRYRARTVPWSVRHRSDIAVTVRDHALELTGPVPALRALRQQMAR